MSVLDALRAGVAIADSVTKSVQGVVTLEAYTGQDGYGGESYAPPVPVRAVIDLTQRQKLTSSGKMVNVIATLTILETVKPNGAVVNPPRQEPIDPRDVIKLPDGRTGPILRTPNAVLDPGTGRPLVNEVALGEVGG